MGNAIGNISSGQVVQYERSCFLENRCKYEEYHESFLKIDGGKSENIKNKDGLGLISSQGHEICSKRRSMLDHSYGSFKGIKEDWRTSTEKNQENTFKSALPRMVPSLSFNEKILNSQAPQAPKKQSAVFRLSLKRRSCEGEETIEKCECSYDLNLTYPFGFNTSSRFLKVEIHLSEITPLPMLSHKGSSI